MVTQAANNYWSSTENNADNAWNFNANNGNMNNNNKSNDRYVRPCFAFLKSTIIGARLHTFTKLLAEFTTSLSFGLGR